VRDVGCFLFGDAGQGLAGMKPGTPPLLQLQSLAGEDLFQFVGTGEQQPAVRRLIRFADVAD
jgi:hypothetical protein